MQLNTNKRNIFRDIMENNNIQENATYAYINNYYEMSNMSVTMSEMRLVNTSQLSTPTCNAALDNDVNELRSSLFGVSLAVPEWEALLTVLVLSVIIVLTIIGNILVILSVFTYKPLRIVQNFFIVSLAVADLTVALLVLPFNVAYSILGRWEFGITMCKMWLTCDVMCCTSSILNLCVIAMDRYWAITDPINYAQKRTVGRVLLLITGIWLLSLLISSPPLVGWNDWPEEFTNATPCELNSDRGYVIYSSLGSFFIPLVIMTIVYVEIYIATRRRLRERAQASKISSIALRCSAAAIETNDELVIKQRWTQSLLCCSSKTSAQKVMEAVDLESLSSETPVNNEISQQQVEDADELNEATRAEILERKRARRPRIKDSIRQTRKQLPLRKAQKALDSTKQTMSKNNGSTTTTVDKDNSKQQQVCIEVCMEGEEGTSVFDGDEVENRSLKISPPQSSAGVVSSLSLPLQKKTTGGLYQIIEERQKISLSKERRAARTLGIIMGIFVICWLPFSLMYVILPFCESCCPTNKFKNFITWLGYVNSGLNPVIYTIFNLDYRRAFKRLLGMK